MTKMSTTPSLPFYWIMTPEQAKAAEEVKPGETVIVAYQNGKYLPWRRGQYGVEARPLDVPASDSYAEAAAVATKYNVELAEALAEDARTYEEDMRRARAGAAQ
jgi:hypothetical protein